MALCFGCHQHVSSFPLDHIALWKSKFSEEQMDRVLYLHNRNHSLIKKKDIATEENYKKLKLMLMKYTGGLK